jgi:hypothetical protein
MKISHLLALCAASAASLSADFIIKDPKACAEAGAAQPITLEESPLRVALGGSNDDASGACAAHDEKGGILRVWKFPHQYQRMAGTKAWKIVIEKGDGDRATHALPVNSVVGVFFQQKGADGKWKAWRGPSSKNPIALTQPPVAFNLDKVTSQGAGGLKQQFLVWDVLTVDALADTAKGGTMKLPEGADIRAESVWVWQGLNPIPKKVKLETGKAKLSILAE